MGVLYSQYKAMYLKQTKDYASIPQGLLQTFHHEFNLGVSKDIVVKMFQNKRITERDLEIVKFLYIFKFATGAQLAQLLGGGNTEEALIARLNKLVNARILNKCLLSRVTENRIFSDSLQIYCLDMGGRYLLANFSNIDVDDWFTSSNMKSSELISKELITVDFYLNLFKQTNGGVEYFLSSHSLQANRMNITPSFEFSIQVDGVRSYFIGEVLRDYDTPFLFREKAQKLESLLTTNAWKKFFYDNSQAPFLLLICDDDSLAKEAAQVISQCTDIERYRITTRERMKQPLHEVGTFMKYVKEDDELKGVASKTFAPDNFQK